jgi:hypothetical protein
MYCAHKSLAFLHLFLSSAAWSGAFVYGGFNACAFCFCLAPVIFFACDSLEDCRYENSGKLQMSVLRRFSAV